MNKSLILGVFSVLFASSACANMSEAKQVKKEAAPEAQVSAPDSDPIANVSKIATKAQSGVSRDQRVAGMELKRESLTELERLAVPMGSLDAPTRESVLPYRFEDVSRLLSMLYDPEWSTHWRSITTTIGMAADKEAALELIEYIKSDQVPVVRGREDKYAQLQAITALGHTLIDQDVPEVLAFLENLTSEEYARALAVADKASVQHVRSKAIMALGVAATDEAMTILERLIDEARAERSQASVQAFSVDRVESGDNEATPDNDIELLEMYLDYAKGGRAGMR